MPSIIDGHASGVESKPIIEKLVELKKLPIQRLEKQQDTLLLENRALGEMQKQLKKLYNSLRTLYSFENAFLQKKVSSEDNDYILGIASKNANEQSVSIKIDNIAQPLIISSGLIPRDKKFSPSIITIYDLQKEFEGGSLKNLVKFLNDEYKDILKSRLIHVNSQSDKIILKGIESGKKGVFVPKSNNGLFHKLSITKKGHGLSETDFLDKPLEDKPLDLSEEKLDSPVESISQKKDILFLPESITDASIGEAKFNPTYKEMKLEGANSSEKTGKSIRTLKITLPKNSTEFEVNIGLLTREKVQAEIPKTVTVGPTNMLNVKGIKLETYNIERNRPSLSNKVLINRNFEIIFVYKKTSKNKNHSVSVSGEQKFKINPGLEKITFVANNHTVLLKDAYFHFTSKDNLPEEKSNNKKSDNNDALLSENKKKHKKTKQEQIFQNLVQEAKNSKLLVDGVAIERESSKGIKDIIDGVSLDLFKKSEEPIILKIEKDLEKAKKQVSLFIEEYNTLIELHQEFSSVDTESGLGEFDERKEKNGILAGNSTMRTLMFGVRRKISGVYPALEEPFLKILSALGISTGKIGSQWGDISAGLLELDEEIFENILQTYPKAVKEFFAMDINYDNQLDHGFAYTFNQYLKPYTRTVGGIIQEYVKNNEGQIKRLKKDIVKVEQVAEAERKKLQQKFGRMESLVQKYKSTESFLKRLQKE